MSYGWLVAGAVYTMNLLRAVVSGIILYVIVVIVYYCDILKFICSWCTVTYSSILTSAIASTVYVQTYSTVVYTCKMVWGSLDKRQSQLSWP